VWGEPMPAGSAQQSTPQPGARRFSPLSSFGHFSAASPRCAFALNSAVHVHSRSPQFHCTSSPSQIHQMHIMKWLLILPLAFAFTSYGAETTDADAKPKKDLTFLDPAKAGPDYADQGEYKNDWGGAQVIALGDDKFRMVSYKGGLPGTGWDKEFKQEVNGKRDGSKIVFTGQDEYRAELADGKITINSANGGPWTMEKTERKSPTLGAKPPEGAIVLFDGSNAD